MQQPDNLIKKQTNNTLNRVNKKVDKILDTSPIESNLPTRNIENHKQSKNSAHYQKLYRERLRASGLIKKEVWILPENGSTLSAVEKMLRVRTSHNNKILNLKLETNMHQNDSVWTISSLYSKLTHYYQSLPKLDGDHIVKVELLEGTEPALLITHSEYGDLPIIIALHGDHLIVEAFLWSKSDIKNQTEFQDSVLRSRRLFPLSTIGLDTLPDGTESYVMTGSLSAYSQLQQIVSEIETLAHNVITAAEAFEAYLK